MGGLSEAVCQVAPEWWGTYGPEQARPKLAVQGCQVCPLNGPECLSSWASVGRVTFWDVYGFVASGLDGQQLVEAINSQVTGHENREPGRPRGMNVDTPAVTVDGSGRSGATPVPDNSIEDEASTVTTTVRRAA